MPLLVFTVPEDWTNTGALNAFLHTVRVASVERLSVTRRQQTLPACCHVANIERLHRARNVVKLENIS